MSPRTKTSHAPSHSCVSTTSHVRQTEKISSWRNSSLLDRFTPAWKRLHCFKNFLTEHSSVMCLFLEVATTWPTFTVKKSLRFQTSPTEISRLSPVMETLEMNQNVKNWHCIKYLSIISIKLKYLFYLYYIHKYVYYLE